MVNIIIFIIGLILGFLIGQRIEQIKAIVNQDVSQSICTSKEETELIKAYRGATDCYTNLKSRVHGNVTEYTLSETAFLRLMTKLGKYRKGTSRE